jgi:hypothetical protein
MDDLKFGARNLRGDWSPSEPAPVKPSALSPDVVPIERKSDLPAYCRVVRVNAFLHRANMLHRANI